MERTHPHPDPLPSRERENETDAARGDPSRTRSFFERTPPRWLLLVLVCLVLAIRGRAMLAMQDSLDEDPDRYSELAWNLQQRHGFGLRDGAGKFHLTAFRPPLYPFVLAPLEYLPDSHTAYGLVHVVLGAATACIVWRLGLAWGLPPLASLLAAALVTVDPILLNQQTQVMTETLAAFLASWTLLALSRAAGHNSLSRAALAGALLGLCILCRPTFAAWFIAVAIIWPFVIFRPRVLLRSATLVTSTVLVLAPWTVRNHVVFGQPIITTTHGGDTLLLANNPEFYAYLRTGAWGSVWDSTNFRAWWEPQIGGRLSPTGWELTRDRMAYEVAFQIIAAQPGIFAYACVVRVGRLWGVLPHQLSPDESPTRRGMRWAVAVFYTFELLLAAIGLWILGRRLWVTPAIWGVLLLLAFTAVHTVYWTDLRMRAPLTSVVAILAAAAVAGLASKRPIANPTAQTV